MLVLAALGRSALSAPDAIGVEQRVRAIGRGLAPIARNHRLVVFHASGASAAAVGLHAHLLGRELQNALPGLAVASLVGHCVVAGSGNGSGFTPCRVVELAVLRRLLEDAQTLPCLGGIPVRIDARGEIVSTGPDFDRDEAAAGLATELGADALLMLSDADGVHREWPAREDPIAWLDARLPEAVPEGIARKVRAACHFAATRDTFAVIGRADRAAALLAGHAGTCVRADAMANP